MVSASGIASVLLLIGALAIVVLQINKKEHEVQESARMETPMIGMTMHQGPWPFCLKNQMSGDACCQKIEAYAEDVRGNCIVLGPNDDASSGFDPTRVRVFVDSDGVVSQIPDRG